MLRGIIFDMDGVLWDSISAHSEAFLEVLAPYNQSFNYLDYTGMTTKEVFQKYFAKEHISVSVSEEKIDQLVKMKQKLAFDKLTSRPPLKEDVTNILLKLSKHYSLGLATSGSKSSCELFLKASKTGPYFKSIITGENIKGKPAPDIYLKAAEQMNIKASQLVVVEDALKGIEAAQNAGMKVIAIAGTHPLDELEKAGVAFVISSLSELEENNDLQTMLHS
jgi:HAD superfamily hydrolase (TIGR01509 family)